MDRDKILNLARSAVPEHLHSLAHITTENGPVKAAFGGAARQADEAQTVAQRLANRFQVQLGTGERPDSADVEFVENTPLGQRSTVVQIRAGKVANVLKKG